MAKEWRIVITITAAKPRDARALAELLQEMNRFYGEQTVEPVDTKISNISSVLFTSSPAAYALLAWEGQELAGMAAYSFLWPAIQTTKSLYLKELYVRQDHRGNGAGRLLMRRLFKTAAEHGCSRVEWTTDVDNAEAHRFYETLGFSVNPSKVSYRAENLHILAP